MIKTKGADGTSAVTFTLDPRVGARVAVLCGEWNGWALDAHVMEQDEGGGFSVTVVLEPGRRYRFRYLLDGERWENDWEADAYEANDFGEEDSIVDLTGVGGVAGEIDTPAPPPAQAPPAKAATTKEAPKKAPAKRAPVKKAAAKATGARPGAEGAAAAPATAGATPATTGTAPAPIAAPAEVPVAKPAAGTKSASTKKAAKKAAKKGLEEH